MEVVFVWKWSLWKWSLRGGRVSGEAEFVRKASLCGSKGWCESVMMNSLRIE